MLMNLPASLTFRDPADLATPKSPLTSLLSLMVNVTEIAVSLELRPML